jgi:hypothetical protein
MRVGFDSPLERPTFAHVSRHYDVALIAAIMASRSLPTECYNNEHRILAHALYWAERDREAGIACALAEEGLAQHRSGVYRSREYLEATLGLSSDTIAMIERSSMLPTEFLGPSLDQRVRTAHQIFWRQYART